MSRTPAQDAELPDYLEIGTEEVYHDPGSTLPQDSLLPTLAASAATQKKSAQPGADDTLPPDQTSHLGIDAIRDEQSIQDPPAILAGHGASGRLEQDGPMPKRVLVVDDDLTARLYLRSRLMLRGHVQIFEACSAAQALELLHSLPELDAALLDVDMGAHNGFDLCKSIRTWVRSEGRKQPTIYMITSRSSLIDKMRAKLAGADAFLTKPPLPYELKNLLARL
jgi:CheY-like chemotaxis protein